MSDDPRLAALGLEQPSAALEEAGSALSAPAPEDGRNRSDIEALKEGAAMLTQAGNRVAALALMWSAVAIDPLDLGAHRRLAAMLANAGDIEGAANEYARYIDFLLPVGELPRATMELAYGATMLGGHMALIEAAEKIATAVRALVPAPAEIASLPAPRLLPKVPFRFCVHDDGDRVREPEVGRRGLERCRRRTGHAVGRLGRGVAVRARELGAVAHPAATGAAAAAIAASSLGRASITRSPLLIAARPPFFMRACAPVSS